MPAQAAASITHGVVKNYKELLKKIAYHGACHEQPASETGTSAAGAYPLSLGLQQQAHYIITEFQQQRTRAEASFEHSFDRLKQLALFDVTALRASYHASKHKAKERLKQVVNAQLQKYLGVPADGAAHTQQARALGPAGDQKAAATPASGLDNSRAPSAVQAEELSTLYGSYGYLRSAVLYLVGHVSRAYMTSLNTTHVDGLGVMEAALRRPAGQPLITVSNHVAAMDDPLVVATLLPPQALEQPEAIRWTLCATDRCFKYAAAVPFFRAAKVLPVARGGGMAQPGMQAAEERLAAGEWVHIFPEGTRSRDGVTLGPVRKGIGRLVASCPQAPLVVPFVHRGMENIMPRGKMVPAVGQEVRILVGDPIPVSDILDRARAERWPEDRLHTAVALRVSGHLAALKRRLDGCEAGTGTEGCAATTAGASGGDVSSLDLFDPQDVVPRRRGMIGTAWERVKFKMQHRSWLSQQARVEGGPAGAAALLPAVLGEAAAGGAAASAANTGAAAYGLAYAQQPQMQRGLPQAFGWWSVYNAR